MRRSSRKRLFAALVAVAAALVAVALAFSRSGRELRWWSASGGGKGYYVVDGDTIRLAGVGPVRYIGVDAPERGEPFYGEARRYNAELLSRGELSLRYGRDRRDRYGRALAYVYVRADAGRTVFVNEELVRAGWATALEVPPNTEFARAFRRAEEEARRRGRGVWAGGGAVGK
ncbi:MAG: nuclease [candidate division Zixibacteria bacterium]|nr:nuclease [candidate division Zixibacteria bacterium]